MPHHWNLQFLGQAPLINSRSRIKGAWLKALLRTDKKHQIRINLYSTTRLKRTKTCDLATQYAITVLKSSPNTFGTKSPSVDITGIQADFRIDRG